MLSIAINQYKNPELLKLCLKSIQDNVKDIEYEIIVVTGATEEDTRLMMREDFPEVRFFPLVENVGFGKMVKKGIEESCGDYLLLLNGDILVKPNSVEKMLSFLQNNKSIGIIGPQILNFNETFQPSCFRFVQPITIVYRRTFLGKLSFAKKHLANFLMKDYNHQKPKDVDWLMGSALMTSREALAKVGYIDDRFFMYFEDTDWCWRFWENNYRVVYFPQSKMLHYHGKGSGKGGVLHSLFLNKLTWIHISSALKYFWKHFGRQNPRKVYFNNLRK
jgi:GT2 family glycosyltransferase